MSYIKVGLSISILIGVLLWLMPEMFSFDFFHVVIIFILPSLLVIAMAFGGVLRLRGVFKGYPLGALCIDKDLLCEVRALYLRPITEAAKVANLPWALKTLSGNAPGYIGGRWEIDYLDGYLLPVLAQSRLLDICASSKRQGARLVSADCVVHWGAAYPFRFYYENGQIIDWVEERKFLRSACPIRVNRYPWILASASSGTSLLIGMTIAITAPVFIAARVEEGMSLCMAWVELLSLNLVLIVRPWLLLAANRIYSLPFPDRNKAIPMSQGINFLHVIGGLEIRTLQQTYIYFSLTSRGLVGELENARDQSFFTAAIAPAMTVSLSLLGVFVLSASAGDWLFFLSQCGLCAVLWAFIRYKLFSDEV